MGAGHFGCRALLYVAEVFNSFFFFLGIVGRMLFGSFGA
jgi:hypothetical protein